jgi:predicted kinase
MTDLFASLVPEPASSIDWPAIAEAFAWFRRLEGCPQNPQHHAEGNVLIHTRMVCEALMEDAAWQCLDPPGRQTLFWGALLHDVAKPDCTHVQPDGRVRTRAHSHHGQIAARSILWRLGAPFAQREQICHLIAGHQLPFYILERAQPERIVHEISLKTRCDFQAILADADARGRIAQDQARLLDNIELFRQLARDEGCFDKPKAFPTPHTRFLYFRKAGRPAEAEAYDDTRMTVTMLSGLPASGKDSWIAANAPAGTAIVSLDALRKKLGVAPTDNQGVVISAAKAKARPLLAAATPFIWNATNIGKATRATLSGLFSAYRAKIAIVYLETAEAELLRRNALRPEPVPPGAIERMQRRWEPPTLTECHELSVALS